MPNELPSLTEGSGALAGRFIIVLFPNSFYGKEDVGLTQRLLQELRGILNWAIDGYHRLRVRGHFVQPPNAQEAIETIEMLGAPVKAFIRDCCVVGANKTVSVDNLFARWKIWCTDDGRRDPGTKEWFGRNLHSAVPGVRVTRPRTDQTERERHYEGIDLIPPPPQPQDRPT